MTKTKMITTRMWIPLLLLYILYSLPNNLHRRSCFAITKNSKPTPKRPARL